MAERTVDISSPILSRNERLAAELRERFARTHTFVVNVLSSPGSGKTLDDSRHRRASARARPALGSDRGRYRE